MEAASQLVLGLLQIGTIQLRHTETAPLVPLTDLPARLLSELVPATISTELSKRLQALVLSAPPTPQTIVELRRITEQLVHAISRDPQRSARLETIAQHVQTIAAINQDAVGGQHAIRHLHIDLANSPLLHYVQEWHIRADPPQPNSLILCQVSDQPGEYVVRSHGQTYIERRIALHYRVNLANPAVAPHALTATPTENLPRERQEWQQRPLPDDDLAIYTEQERYKGRVVSRRLALPIVVDGAPLHVTLATTEDAYVIATDIVDENDQLLIRVIRWPPVT